MFQCAYQFSYQIVHLTPLTHVDQFNSLIWHESCANSTACSGLPIICTHYNIQKGSKTITSSVVENFDLCYPLLLPPTSRANCNYHHAHHDMTAYELLMLCNTHILITKPPSQHNATKKKTPCTNKTTITTTLQNHVYRPHTCTFKDVLWCAQPRSCVCTKKGHPL